MSKVQQFTGIALVFAVATGVIATTAGAGSIAIEPSPSAQESDVIVSIQLATTDSVDSSGVGWTSLVREVPSEEVGGSVDSLRPVGPLILLPPAGYSRYDDSDPLENTVRRSVYETAVRSPGTYLSQIADEIDHSLSTVRYHVRILEHERQLRTKMIDGKRRVFPRSIDDHEKFAALNDEARREVLQAVERLEPTNGAALSTALDRSPSTVSYHLARLHSIGLVSRDRVGESVRVTLTEAARDELDDPELAG